MRLTRRGRIVVQALLATLVVVVLVGVSQVGYRKVVDAGGYCNAGGPCR